MLKRVKPAINHDNCGSAAQINGTVAGNLCSHSIRRESLIVVIRTGENVFGVSVRHRPEVLIRRSLQLREAGVVRGCRGKQNAVVLSAVTDDLESP